jgi:chromate transporter
VTLVEFARYFLRLGTLGFGGPIALTAAIQRDLVELRAWVTPAEYKEGLVLAQLAPGPLAAQLAIYLGWVRWRVVGATVTGLAFVSPSLVMVLVLAWLYLHYGGLPWMQAAFYGIGAAVIAVIARGALKLAERTVGRDPLLAAVMLANTAVVVWTARELLWGPSDAWPTVRLFRQGGACRLRSGLAVVPFLHGGVVESFGWLTDRQFLDAVAVSMITPGPVVITVAFIGYLVAGPLGGLVAALGIFLPTYLVVILAAPWFRRVMENRSLRSAVDGVTAAAAGAIAGAVIVLGRRALIDGPTWGIALLTLLLLWRMRRIPEPVLILAAGGAGLLLAR